ncbi:class IV adenylate cyclase [Candidatus Woesearchaeota archaeon]|nr:class IV adenylate cyclase [Candidatus Woesearchaeota archaeon]
MEIEVKARCDDTALVKKKLAELGAIKKGEKRQVDEYYNHPSRDTRKTKEYIRVRYTPGKEGCVLAYHINLSDGVNKEYEVKIDDLETLKQILDGFGFPLLGTIDKNREVFKLGELTITVDDVKNIGTFVEVEADGEEDEIDEKKVLCKEILKKLDLKEAKKVWLCDIATGKVKLE